MKSSKLNNTQILRLFLIISLSIISIRTDSLDERPPKVDPLNSGVIELTPENILEETSRFNYGFVMFTSEDCKHSKAVEPLYHETCTKLRTIIHDKEEASEKQGLMRANLQTLGFFLINAKKHPELMEKYGVKTTPHFVWFNNVKDHYRQYTGETELPKYFFEFALKQIEFNVEEITLESFMKFPEERELNGENLILFVGSEQGKNNFYFTHLMQCAFNNDIDNLYKTNDEEIKRHFNVKFKNQQNNFDAILFKIRNKKIDLHQYERLNISTFDFMRLDLIGKNAIGYENYSKNFDLAKANPIKKVNDLIQLFSHNPVTIFSYKKEKLIMNGIPTLVMVHDYDIESSEYKNMLGIFSEISKKYRKELFLMISSKYSRLTQLFAESFSLHKEDFPAICLTSMHGTTKETQKIDKFRVINKGEVFTKESVTKFIEDWKNMKLSVYFPSEEVPQDQPDEDGIYKFVAKNFSNLLSGHKRFILMNVCSDRLEVCEKFRERLTRISHKLKNVSRIMVGEFNPYLNEVEYEFDTRYIPSLYLLPDRGDRFKEMKRFTGRLNTREIVKWVIDETNITDYEDNKLPLEETLSMEEDLTDLKAVDLENKGTSRKIYAKLLDPVQKELWEYPPTDDIDLENRYHEDFYEKYFNPTKKLELNNNKNDEL